MTKKKTLYYYKGGTRIIYFLCRIGLGIYGDSNSESEEEQNEHVQTQNNDSDEELIVCYIYIYIFFPFLFLKIREQSLISSSIIIKRREKRNVYVII